MTRAGAGAPCPGASCRWVVMLRARRDAVAATLTDTGEQWEHATTRWMGGLVFLLCAVLAGGLLALVPPTAKGEWGWNVAIVVIGARIVAATWLLSGRGPVRPGRVYAISLLGIAGLCALQFLASADAFYHDLVLIDLLYVAAVHTPRRTAVASVLAVGGMVPALVRSGPVTVTWAEWGAEAILWALVLGLVVVYTVRARSQRDALRIASRQASALARIDVLTGLGNRRSFDETLERELSAARRHATPLSVLVADLDGFKAVNDRHGHPAGDEALRQVAHVLVDTVRRPDACFRWGGDEFAVVLPRTSPEAAELVANRVRAAVADGVHVPGGHRLGISVGIADLRADQVPAELLAAADEALLTAKAARPEARGPSWRFPRVQARGTARR